MKKIIFYLAFSLFSIFSETIFAQISVEQEIYNKGIDNFYKKYYYQAIDDFNILINGNKTDYLLYAYMYRASCKIELGKHSEAITDFSAALAKYPNNADLLNGRAWSYCFAGYYNAAINDATKAISIKKQANYYDTRATAYALLRSNANAIADFNESIKLGATPLYYYKRGWAKKNEMDFKGAENDFATARALDKTESYTKLNDPLIAAFVYKSNVKTNSTSTATTQGTTTKTETPMALSSVKHKISFGNWYIYFPGKPTEQTSSNSTFRTNYTAHYESGEWLYMVQYVFIDYEYFKKYLLNDFLKDIRLQYAKAINGTISSPTTTTMKGFDQACNYYINTTGRYGYFRDGIVDYRIVRIGVFNTKRYPTTSEFNEFYNTFSKTY
jgi:tetratricopeptide (TPR) repeat protein